MKVKYFDLKNKNVFITGGGSGIGASIVEHFCEQECDVYFVDINRKESNKLIKNLKKRGLKAPHFIECNLIKIKNYKLSFKK
jgi:NAD(P)-dependent dehydrogenase (short-subunit alcohol dehydrogenase family)